MQILTTMPPAWPELASKYAQYQGQPDAARIQGEKLIKGKFLKRIKAHKNSHQR